jgi:hypothetical protein
MVDALDVAADRRPVPPEWYGLLIDDPVEAERCRLKAIMSDMLARSG